MTKISMFDCMYEDFKIDKTIRLIELFAGVGSQAMALRNLGADFEHHKVVEFDKYAIASYNAIHETNFEVMDITNVKGEDLEIVNTDSFTYLLTYSFPCQDLSVAGKMKGMSKDSGTRSGLLWEVERLLNEVENLPQVLLMENVPQVIGKKNIDNFHLWQQFLEDKGYTNFVDTLNAKNYGVAQNRNRTFMVSILGQWNYNFPKPFKLEKRLKDYLEDEVDEKYYLSDKMLACFTDMTDRNGFVRGKRFNPHEIESNYAYAITTLAGNRATDNFIKIPEATQKGYAEAHDGDGVYINRPHQKRGVVQNQMIQTLKTSGSDVGVVVPFGSYYTRPDNQGNINTQCNRAADEDGYALTVACAETGKVYEKGLRIRKLTPKECWRLMGFTDEDFHKAKQVNSNSQLYKQAGNSNFILHKEPPSLIFCENKSA